jgi:hypothetical protein
VSWDSEVFDLRTLHDTSTNNERFTVKNTGKHLVQGAIKYSGYAVVDSGYVKLWIKENGSTDRHHIVDAVTVPPAAAGSLPFTAIVELTKGDYVTMLWPG